MNAVATSPAPSSDSRSTSIDNLGDTPASTAPVQQLQQQLSPQAPSDSELVNDILKEIHQSNQNSGGGGGNSGIVDANTVQQQQMTNDSAFARQMDPNLTHDIPPTTPQQVQNYADAQQVGGDSDAGTADRNGTGSYNTDLARTLSAAQPIDAMTTENDGWFGFLGNLDIIQYAKTILLFMIVYIVVSNVNVQSLLCKLPYFSIPAVEGAVAAPQMSFLGNVGVALVAGVLMATVQASV